MKPLAIAAVLDRADGRTLVVRRGAHLVNGGYWTPVTGRIEPGESLGAAAERELLEEVGVLARAGAEVFRCDAVNANFELVWLACTLVDEGSADAIAINDELADARWVTPAEAARLEPMFPATRDFYARLAG